VVPSGELARDHLRRLPSPGRKVSDWVDRRVHAVERELTKQLSEPLSERDQLAVTTAIRKGVAVLERF
jgi:hypothetical protein